MISSESREKRTVPDWAHVARALDFYARWNTKAGFDGCPSDPDLTRAYVQYLAEEIAEIEAGTDAWNRAINACIRELGEMQRQDCDRLARRIAKLRARRMPQVKPAGGAG